MVLIWALSSLSTLPSLEEIPFKDKGAHFVEYGVLGLFYSYALTRHFSQWKGYKVFFITCLLATIWGGLDELHQAFVPGRDSSLLDVCADVLGAVLAAGLYRLAASVASRLPARHR
jgi:VanZ family protein